MIDKLERFCSAFYYYAPHLKFVLAALIFIMGVIDSVYAGTINWPVFFVAGLFALLGVFYLKTRHLFLPKGVSS